MDHKPRILFFSTGDSTRSQMAEGFARRVAGNELIAVSTAVLSVESDPLAEEVMSEVGVDISTQRPKDVAESLKEHFSYVVTVCDSSKERFPVWPFSRNIVNWSLIDPEQISGSTEQKRQVFRTVRDDIRQRVNELLPKILSEVRPQS
ncbi:MAG TPA: arsenate reductase ArsC [Candidatus Acidoferrum sp.]|jgi:arsenate reductase